MCDNVALKIVSIEFIAHDRKQKQQKIEAHHHQRMDANDQSGPDGSYISRLLRKKVCRCYYWMKICKLQRSSSPNSINIIFIIIIKTGIFRQTKKNTKQNQHIVTQLEYVKNNFIVGNRQSSFLYLYYFL